MELEENRPSFNPYMSTEDKEDNDAEVLPCGITYALLALHNRKISREFYLAIPPKEFKITYQAHLEFIDVPGLLVLVQVR
jgi:hypothetical protein